MALPNLKDVEYLIPEKFRKEFWQMNPFQQVSLLISLKSGKPSRQLGPEGMELMRRISKGG